MDCFCSEWVLPFVWRLCIRPQSWDSCTRPRWTDRKSNILGSDDQDLELPDFRWNVGSHFRFLEWSRWKMTNYISQFIWRLFYFYVRFITHSFLIVKSWPNFLFLILAYLGFKYQNVPFSKKDKVEHSFLTWPKKI